MQDDRKTNVPYALYHAMGEYVALNTVSAEQEKEIIQEAMEQRSVQVLEAICRVLEDDRYDDPECFERIDAIVMTYHRELDIDIDRHNELD